MIATASSEEKRELALELGADVGDRAGRRGADRAAARGQRRAQVDVVFEIGRRRGLRRLLQGARAVRADRRLRDRDAASRTRCAPARCCATRARWSASTCSTACERPGMFAEALADLFARRRARRAAADRRRTPIRSSRPPQAQIDLRERRTTGKLLLDPHGLSRISQHDHDLRRARAVRAHAAARCATSATSRRARSRSRRSRALLRGPRRDRPGADGHRQDGGLRAADHGVRRPGRARRCRRSC